MLDGAGRPVVGLEVGLNDERAKTDQSGRFVFAKAPEVYDLIVPGPNLSTVYQGIRRREIVVFQNGRKPKVRRERPPSLATRKASLTGTVLGGDPNAPANPDKGHVVQIRFFSDKAQTSTVSKGTNYGPVDLSWNGPAEIAGEVLALQMSGEGSRGRAWFARRSITVKDGQTSTANIQLAPVPTRPRPAPSVLFEGRPAAKDADHMREWYESSRWGEVFVRAANWYNLSEASDVPDPKSLGSDFSLCLYAFAANPWLDTVSTVCGYEVGEQTVLTLLPAPVITSPAPGSIATPGMQFAWSAVPHALYELEIGPSTGGGRGKRIRIVTTAQKASWPDLTAFGIEFPQPKPPSAYHATLRAFGSYDCIDEILDPKQHPTPNSRFSTRSQELNIRVHPPVRKETAECQYPRGTAVVCNQSRNVEEREFYVLSAINDKLRLYPEFADAIGIYCVRDCNGARAYAKAYHEYSRAHPGFDADHPLEVEPEPPLPPGVPAPLGAPVAEP